MHVKFKALPGTGGVANAACTLIACGIAFKVNNSYSAVSVNARHLSNAIAALQCATPPFVISAPNANGNFTIGV